MKGALKHLRTIRRGQDYLLRATRHLANRAAVLHKGQLFWVGPSPEADADGILTRLFNELDALAQRAGEPKRTKHCPTRKREVAEQ